MLGVPLVWFPRLLDATAEQRGTVRISSRGCIGTHWMRIFRLPLFWLDMAIRPSRAIQRKQPE
ncbi:hypothetical protein [Phyllobacterium lublinensis]|uniref:hypothetical protein n=1 Tax=Phyllobacterium lublinensis TaxID=2875708 RepID=UPI00351D341E